MDTGPVLGRVLTGFGVPFLAQILRGVCRPGGPVPGGFAYCTQSSEVLEFNYSSILTPGREYQLREMVLERPRMAPFPALAAFLGFNDERGASQTIQKSD